MHGINIPKGAAVPEVTQTNTYQIMPYIKALENNSSLPFFIKCLIVFDYELNISVASLSNLLSGQRYYLVTRSSDTSFSSSHTSLFESGLM